MVWSIESNRKAEYARPHGLGDQQVRNIVWIGHKPRTCKKERVKVTAHIEDQGMIIAEGTCCKPSKNPTALPTVPPKYTTPVAIVPMP